MRCLDSHLDPSLILQHSDSFLQTVKRFGRDATLASSLQQVTESAVLSGAATTSCTKRIPCTLTPLTASSIACLASSAPVTCGDSAQLGRQRPGKRTDNLFVGTVYLAHERLNAGSNRVS